MRIVLLLAGLAAISPVHAQRQLRFGAGVSHETNAESTYGWELDYAQGLAEHAYLTVGWLNEGHQQNDYRDGLSAQLWARADFFGRRLSLAAGIGPFLFFNTTRDEPHPYYVHYDNNHGLRPIYSAELTWHFNRSWLMYLRANRVNTGALGNTSMLLLGFGYQFDGRSTWNASPARSAPSASGGSGGNELTLYAGRTLLNSFAPERSTAFAVEYRRRLGRYTDWSVGWLNEGGNQLIRRNGITAQFWLVRPLLHERLALGVGAGAYVVVNQQNQTFAVINGQVVSTGGDDERVAGIVSLAAGYRFDAHWFARVSFSRLITNYDRDADVILFGGGYRF